MKVRITLNVQISWFQVLISKNQDKQQTWFHSIILYLMIFIAWLKINSQYVSLWPKGDQMFKITFFWTKFEYHPQLREDKTIYPKIGSTYVLVC